MLHLSLRSQAPARGLRAAGAMLLSAAALITTVSPARADSIAYVKDGNVWLSTGDGSRQFQVTSQGGYSDVSQADDGTMIALKGVRLQKLDRLGNVLADFDTPVSDTRPAGSKTFWGPFDPAISPDGTKVAYTWYYMTQSQAPGCYPPQCVTTINEGGTGYTHSDRSTNWDEPGFAQHSGWRNPSWVDDATTVLSDPTHLPNADVVVDRPGERGANGFLVKNWFSDNVGGNPHTSGGEVSRDRAKAAFVTGADDSTLTLYRVSSFPVTFRDGDADPSTRPEICYRYSNPVGGHFGTPTFSPDGSRVAFAVGDGINVVDVPSFAAGCTTTGASPSSRLLIPGASEPDWGPADVPASRPAPPSGTTTPPAPVPSTPAPPASPPPSPSGGCPASGGCSPHGAVRLTVPRASLKTALSHGFRVLIKGSGDHGSVRLVARLGRRVVAVGSGRADATGKASIRMRFRRSAVRVLRGKRAVTLLISGAGTTSKVTLRP